MDENIFFRKATLLMCSSLDIEVALGRCREFLSQHIPADEISLNMYDPATKTVRYLAKASQSECEKLNVEIKLPQDLIESIESGTRIKDYLIVNRPSDDLFSKQIPHPMGLKNASYIALRLVIEGKRLGVADLFAYGADRFEPRHARLFSLLREPIAIAMANALQHQETVELKDRLASDNRYLSKKLRAQSTDTIIGAEKGLSDVMLMVKQVSPLNNTVLLLGETGVGKEVIANEIHRLSSRSDGPFIKVNCGAIPESLIDSELFGHEKGAFTGAVNQKYGLFERADKGTIFLDEIGELPLQAQVRLLRVLQFKEIERVGGSPPIRLDIRIIAATHQNLENMVKEGRFREDLWYRINVFPIQIPPLRQRKMDVPDFIQHFTLRKSRELGLKAQIPFSQKEIEPLMDYDWPGNVRELENVVERSIIQERSRPLLPDQKKNIAAKGLEPMAPIADPAPRQLNELIADHIENILAMTDGKVNGPEGAAAILGIHPNTLRNKMNKLGIFYGRRYHKKQL